MRLLTSTAALLVAIGLLAPAVFAGPVSVNIIPNGDFELYAKTNGGEGAADGALLWAHHFGSNAQFLDVNGDTDREAYVSADYGASNHNFWQSIATAGQAVSANFESFEYTVEEGTIAPSANNQIGLSFTPLHSQHPWAGIFWEGAVIFDSDDIEKDLTEDNNRVSLDPIEDGRLVCVYPPACADATATFNGGTKEEKAQILSQARIVQISFWNFNRQDSGFVVIDDVGLNADPTAVSAQPNPCDACLEE